MQDVLNTLLFTIAIAFTALMAMDFIAGLIALATPQESPIPPVPPRKLTLTEIMDRPDIVPTPEQQRELDQLEDLFAPTPKAHTLGQLLEDLFAPTPKAHTLGQLLLEEYDRESKLYWATWHQTYQSVRANLQVQANLQKLIKVEEATTFEEPTTQNFPENETVNEMPVVQQSKKRGRPRKAA